MSNLRQYQMKYTIALYSFLAVATAANLPSTNPDTVDVVARDEGHAEHGTGAGDDGHGLEKRRRGCRRNCHSFTSDEDILNTTSDASAVMNLNLGALVAGVAGAGFGAIFL
ncbi:uncharacterized protein B0H64DRAFT_374508 [Chaetomium fimeti]|uniref:Uncharacterized protein n=1 Tax=Chaetomium fimeti TaxID=1854472 RepID=A0AAE0LTN5_9PEZI|nr:hypothetical protein B0H64DRAFT_374508 [Chaetomium fimeti]